MNEHSSHPCCHLLSRAIGALGKSAVPVVSKPMVLVELQMIQVVIMCPSLSMVMNQDVVV